MQLLRILASSLLLASLALAQGGARPVHLAVVTIRDAATLDKLMALDLDLAGRNALELPVREVEVIADDAELQRMTAAGLRYRVEVRDLEKTIGDRLARYQMPMSLTPSVGQGAMGGHYTLAQMEAILDEFARKHPAICTQKVSLGKSHENRDIWMIKISDNVQVDENEPEVLYDALHHAREPLSMTTTLLFMDWLLSEYGKDPIATFIVDQRELYFVPCVNPDGYEYNYRNNPNGGGMWRKNRRSNGGSYGVDLNRNWPTGWNAPYGGNSTNPSSDTYRGPSPLSEPETTALDNFIQSRKFVVGCSCHTYSDILLYPYGWIASGPTNEADYRKISDYATSQNNIPAGVTSNILYVAAGGALDHYHEQYKMFGFTPELGKSSEGGFWPNPTTQVDIANRNQHMFRSFALVAGAYVEFDKVAAQEGPGGNSNQVIEPGERGTVDITLKNVGAAATLGRATVTLRTQDPQITIVQGTADLGQVTAFGSAAQSSALSFDVDANHAPSFADFELELSFDGFKTQRRLRVPLAPNSVIGADDFELNLGFARSSGDTATTGRFERAAPSATNYMNRNYQPANDHTSGTGTLCWVTDGRPGTSAGNYDVDAGHTSFVSPVFDLRHVSLPELRFWLYFSESTSDDPFRVDVSDDGGQNWVERYRRNTHTNGWEQIRIEDLPNTAQVQLRFWTQDLNPSLVEACVDDLELRGLVQPGALTLMGSGERGTIARFTLQGEASGLVLPMFAAAKSAPLSFAGIQGQLLLDLQSLFVLPPTALLGKPNIRFDIPIPGDPAFAGLKLHWQQLSISPQELRLGNTQTLEIR
jgi:hypothetical protein